MSYRNLMKRRGAAGGDWPDTTSAGGKTPATLKWKGPARGGVAVAATTMLKEIVCGQVDDRGRIQITTALTMTVIPLITSISKLDEDKQGVITYLYIYICSLSSVILAMRNLYIYVDIYIWIFYFKIK